MKRKHSRAFTKENFKENSCKTHVVCFKQLDFLAAPVKSKQGKWLSLFCFAIFFIHAGQYKAHPLWEGVADCRWDKVPCDYMECFSIESQHMWRSDPFNAHIEGKERKLSPLRRIVKPGVKHWMSDWSSNVMWAPLTPTHCRRYSTVLQGWAPDCVSKGLFCNSICLLYLFQTCISGFIKHTACRGP